jgi:hypothetical protein
LAALSVRRTKSDSSIRTATEHPSSRRRAAREEDWSGPDGRRFPESTETDGRKTRARPAAAHCGKSRNPARGSSCEEKSNRAEARRLSARRHKILSWGGAPAGENERDKHTYGGGAASGGLGTGGGANPSAKTSHTTARRQEKTPEKNGTCGGAETSASKERTSARRRACFGFKNFPGRRRTLARQRKNRSRLRGCGRKTRARKSTAAARFREELLGKPAARVSGDKTGAATQRKMQHKKKTQHSAVAARFGGDETHNPSARRVRRAGPQHA